MAFNRGILALQRKALPMLLQFVECTTPACSPAALSAAAACSWFSQWCQYSGFCYDAARSKAKVVPLDQPGPRPGPVENSDLLAPPPVRPSGAGNELLFASASWRAAFGQCRL